MADSADEIPNKSRVSIVNETGSALQISRDGAELPLQPALVSATRAYRASARAPRTRHAYREAWHRFATWCAREGRTPLSASPETVAGWMTALADGLDGPPRAAATINAYLSAVISAHRAAGHSFDRKHRLVAET
jgi:hypothetical protein